jgi:hypothetical protein
MVLGPGVTVRWVSKPPKKELRHAVVVKTMGQDSLHKELTSWLSKLLQLIGRQSARPELGQLGCMSTGSVTRHKALDKEDNVTLLLGDDKRSSPWRV